MRLLLTTASPGRYMAPPLLGDEQIVCGPDWPDDRAPDGRWRSLRTPVGNYDLGAVLARLPAEQQPDALVSLVDASWRNKPRNLHRFAGPKAVLVADTHHLQTPLSGMLAYLQSEAYDRVILLYDRHHAGFFQAAGMTSLFWLPGLTFPHADAVVRAARQSRRVAQLAFVGQVGKHHGRRFRLFEALLQHRIPAAVKLLPQAAALQLYGTSLVGFNASLNGDLNLRVFEILASGAALLTDQLAPAAGLDTVWTEGRHYLAYRGPDDLGVQARHALAHPAETAAIGAAGAAWFDEHFNEARRRAAFARVLFDGVADERFPLPALGSRRWFDGDRDRLLAALPAYEALQERHRTEERVPFPLDDTTTPEWTELAATLPRVDVRAPAEAGASGVTTR